MAAGSRRPPQKVSTLVFTEWPPEDGRRTVVKGRKRPEEGLSNKEDGEGRSAVVEERGSQWTERGVRGRRCSEEEERAESLSRRTVEAAAEGNARKQSEEVGVRCRKEVGVHRREEDGVRCREEDGVRGRNLDGQGEWRRGPWSTGGSADEGAS